MLLGLAPSHPALPVSVAEISTDTQRPRWGLYRVGWVSGVAPSRRMRGPLGLRIFLMADVFMKLSRRMRLKPSGETPSVGQMSAGHSRKRLWGEQQDERGTHQSHWSISHFCVPT